MSVSERGPLEQAEEELFPGIPYQELTHLQREDAIARAKQIVFEKTGKKIH